MTHRAPVLAVLAALVLGVGWWFLLYQPLLEEEEALVQETSQLQAEESRLRGEIAELERIRDNEMQIRAELSMLEDYIPNGVAQPAALRDLQDTADDAGVVIESLSFGSPVAVEDAPETGDASTTLARIDVAMTVEGSYFQLVDLLRRLEVDVTRALLVQSVSMNEGGEEGFPTLSTSWSGHLFAVVDVASTVAPEEGDAPVDDAGPDAEDGDDAGPDAEGGDDAEAPDEIDSEDGDDPVEGEAL